MAGLKLISDTEAEDAPESLTTYEDGKVETLYEVNFRNVPEMLRKLADEIEDEVEYGYVTQAAMVIFGDKLHIFGWGEKCDAGEISLLLQAGNHKLVREVVDYES